MDDRSSHHSEDHAPDPTSIKSDILLPVVRRLAGRQISGIRDWTCTPIGGGIGGGSIYCFSGAADGMAERWSVILKVLSPGTKGGDDTHVSDWNYYLREAEAYRSSWLGELPGGIAAPRQFGTIYFAEGVCWLWLEDIHASREQWTMEDYRLAARDIGTFNGAYLAGTRMPAYGWFSSNWIKKYVSISAPAMDPLRNSLDHPLIRRWFPGNTGEAFFQIWDRREAHFTLMERLPQTICHFDLFRRNLFRMDNAAAGKETVAIDWAFTGPGCIGADINPLVIASLAFFEVGLERTGELDGNVFEGYQEGLRQAGWQGDIRLARLGYLLATIRYLFSEIGGWFSAVSDERARSSIEQAFGHPLGEIFEYIAAMRNAIAYMDEEKSRLIEQLGLG